MNERNGRAVAIVGLGAILPDAPSAEAFWRNVREKRYSIREVPQDRWSVADYYDADTSAPDKTYSKIGGWVEGFEFDWKRFHIPPRVATSMDQGQQWAVTIAERALADSGHPQRPLDLDRTGVVLGTAMGGERHYLTNLRVCFPEFARPLESVREFLELPAELRQTILLRWHEAVGRRLPEITEDTMPGELANVVSGRVANLLNLHGPNFVADAACASTLAAFDAAVNLLEEGHCDAVITGGVDRNMGVSSFVKFCKIGALSATGTRPFGDGADGFVMGEGAVAFLLRRLADAERDGDRVYAVIRGVAGASDGRGKGITAPNTVGQQFALRRAWEAAGLDPATAGLIEAHGTSTRVGDVVEVESLQAVFGSAPRGSIALGSVKSNFGHLKAGAGAAGLLKAVLALHDGVLPPTLHAERPNPEIDFGATAFRVNHELREWPKSNGTPRRAGVSAYGFGGTNYHVVLEEHVPGSLTGDRRRSVAVAAEIRAPERGVQALSRPPLRGILALGAGDVPGLRQQLEAGLARARDGSVGRGGPDPAALRARERVVVDFDSAAELVERLERAGRALALDTAAAWRPLQGQGVHRGRGPRVGKLAFLFPGQGSQFLNMGRKLAQREPAVAATFEEADRALVPLLGRPLTSLLFVDPKDAAEASAAEDALRQTAVTQPAVLTVDAALTRLLDEFGVRPDAVMGHSLGEYAALVVAGVLPLADALEAAAARGREMTRVSLDDNGKMAAVMAPLEVVEEVLRGAAGYLVAANINSPKQCVIGGASDAVDAAVAAFAARGVQAVPLPVSHAFHTRIVAPASAPLRKVLDRLRVAPGRLPVIGNVTGGVYPTEVEAIKDLLERQIASPVQWVKGLETLYAMGVRTFVEVGPKRALKGFVDEVLGEREGVVSLFTCHPKPGEIESFNQALCGLYAAGYGLPEEAEAAPATRASPLPAPAAAPQGAAALAPGLEARLDSLTALLETTLARLPTASPRRALDRNEAPPGSIVISGTGLGLPGSGKPVMDPTNAERILLGEQFVDLVPDAYRRSLAGKNITRVVKSEDGSGRFEVIRDTAEVIKLAGRAGPFDLTEEYGVPAKLVEALDITTQLAMAAGLDALREAGIPLVQRWHKTTTGKFLPDRWLLPEPLADETGVIFASAFPGFDRFADELTRGHEHERRVREQELLDDLRRHTRDPGTLAEIQRRFAAVGEELAREPYAFDRRFLLRVLTMGHSQFAEYIGARGPNAHVNAACASTVQAVSLAEDWIRSGRCRRVVVIGADNVTGPRMFEWIGSGFLSSGAAATDAKVEEAALPFDRRRHGTLLGMGACGLVVESQDCVEERGMRAIVEVLSTETRNSAFHATRLDVAHIGDVMESLVAAAERRFGLSRLEMAPQMVFVSHETFTPARGGSAAAEVQALRKVFGPAASEIVVANTKGFTGHPMGVGIEDVIAVKILEHGIVPPVPNYREVDPDLGRLNLSRGGRYPVRYSIHLAAGFGSQIALSLTRRVPGGLDRVDSRGEYGRWLSAVSGHEQAETEISKRVLRIASRVAPERPPRPSPWRFGLGPVCRTTAGDGAAVASAPGPAVSVEAPPRPAPARELAPSMAAAPAAPAARPVAAAAPPPPVAAPPPAVVAPPAPSPSTRAPSSAAPGMDPVTRRVMQIVAEKTGYPPEMLDLDLDLEADLGVDTVKQAETFAAVREEWSIPRQENLKLRDFPTLRHVAQFVLDRRPDLATVALAPAAAPVTAAGSASPAVSPAAATAPGTAAPVAAGLDPVTRRVMQIVAEKTGYPPEMLDLDLDLEADLGVDTVKQAETFAAVREEWSIPRQENLKLRDFPTLRHVARFVLDRRPDLAAVAAAPAAAPVAAAASASPAPVPAPPAVPSAAATSVAPPAAAGLDPVTRKVMQIVAEKTGYPPEMLELDLDLEADLGVDTVKQAETFAAVREEWSIPRQENLKLRDFPTLRHVVQFVLDRRPDLAVAAPAEPRAPAVAPVAAAGSTSPAPLSAPPPAPAAATAAATSTPVAAPAARAVDPVTSKVMQIVAEKTGYPPEMLELDLDLEADLGVDTVKQAETFAAVREEWSIPRQEDLKLRDFPTLRHVVQFVLDRRPDLAVVAPAEASAPSAAPVAAAGSASPAPLAAPPAAPAVATAAATSTPVAVPAAAGPDPVTRKVMEIVAEKTGYPPEMLELDLDLEADLGVDTVKQAETFAAVREEWSIPRQENLKLRDFPTLRHVVQFVLDRRPDLAGSTASAAGRSPAPSGAPTLEPAPVAAAVVYPIENADRFPRRVPVPVLRPPLDVCRATGVRLEKGVRALVAAEKGGVAPALASRLRERGVEVVELDPGAPDFSGRVQGLAAAAAVDGVFWLPALDVEPPLPSLDLAGFREANRVRVKALHAAMRALYERFASPGAFLVSATRLGGFLGHGAQPATAPLGGAVAGFTKAFKRERDQALVKVVDFEADASPAQVAEALVEEALRDPGALEVGRADGRRFSVALEERPAADGHPGLSLGKDSVFLVTGAAGGITSAIVADLAAGGGTFYLLDLAPLPAADDPRIALLRQGRERLKLALIEEAKARGERLLPPAVERQILDVERQEAALRAVQSVAAAGGRAVYRSLDLLDGDAVTAAVGELRAAHGRIDVLIHAGGIEISRELPAKSAEEFARVLDIKADGFFSLLKAAEGLPIGATVAFSSIAGRFGNAGQTDYSAANALLCSLSSNLRALRPETRALAIDWTAWGGIGMATRGSIPKIMAAAGIDVLPPEVGIPTVRRELTAGAARGEVLVAGALGMMGRDLDDLGGLDPDALNARLARLQPRFAMIGRALSARLQTGLEVETTLDPAQQPFLRDHALEGTPLLPGVMAIETFAQLSSVLAPDLSVLSVEQVRFDKPLKFHRQQPASFRLRAQAVPGGGGELRVRATLLALIQPRPELPPVEKLHFEALVRLGRDPEGARTLAFAPPSSKSLGITRDSIYRTYFHGPAYQVLERARVENGEAVGLLARNLPANDEPPGAASLMEPRLIELCLQTAGIHQIVQDGRLALPRAVGAVRVHGHPHRRGRLWARVQRGDDGRYAAQVLDDAGAVLVELEGYETVVLQEGARLPEERAAPSRRRT